jgi:hypothetical protein
MQRRDTAFVDRVRVGASIDEISDDLALRISIQEIRARVSVCGVVERFGSSSVAGANRGALCDERLGQCSVIGGGGHMQCRVARVDVVTNRNKEVGVGILAARSHPKRIGGQAGCLIKHSLDCDVVMGGDRSEERRQRTIVELVWFPTSLRHGYSLPDLERGRRRPC